MRRTGREGLHARIVDDKRMRNANDAALADVGEALLGEEEDCHGRVERKRTSKRFPSTVSWAEEVFAKAWDNDALEGSTMVREHRFHSERKWRFDFAWPDQKVALEIEGWGRHQTFDGYRKDCEKYNAATLLGWRVLRVMAADKRQVRDWVEMVKRALCGLDDS